MTIFFIYSVLYGISTSHNLRKKSKSQKNCLLLKRLSSPWESLMAAKFLFLKLSIYLLNSIRSNNLSIICYLWSQHTLQHFFSPQNYIYQSKEGKYRTIPKRLSICVCYEIQRLPNDIARESKKMGQQKFFYYWLHFSQSSPYQSFAILHLGNLCSCTCVSLVNGVGVSNSQFTLGLVERKGGRKTAAQVTEPLDFFLIFYYVC